MTNRWRMYAFRLCAVESTDRYRKELSCNATIDSSRIVCRAQICSMNANRKICIDIQQGPKESKTARTLSVDQLFVAIGRVPNIKALTLKLRALNSAVMA